MILSDINNYYRLGAYGMDLVHSWEPERSEASEVSYKCKREKIIILGNMHQLINYARVGVWREGIELPYEQSARYLNCSEIKRRVFHAILVVRVIVTTN